MAKYGFEILRSMRSHTAGYSVVIQRNLKDNSYGIVVATEPLHEFGDAARVLELFNGSIQPLPSQGTVVRIDNVPQTQPICDPRTGVGRHGTVYEITRPNPNNYGWSTDGLGTLNVPSSLSEFISFNQTILPSLGGPSLPPFGDISCGGTTGAKDVQPDGLGGIHEELTPAARQWAYDVIGFGYEKLPPDPVPPMAPIEIYDDTELVIPAGGGAPPARAGDYFNDVKAANPALANTLDKMWAAGQLALIYDQPRFTDEKVLVVDRRAIRPKVVAPARATRSQTALFTAYSAQFADSTDYDTFVPQGSAAIGKGRPSLLARVLDDPDGGWTPRNGNEVVMMAPDAGPLGIAFVSKSTLRFDTTMPVLKAQSRRTPVEGGPPSGVMGSEKKE